VLQSSGRTKLEDWYFCGDALLPRLTRSVHPILGFTGARSLTRLTLVPWGREGNLKMQIPSMLPLLSSPFIHFFLPSLLFFHSGGIWEIFSLLKYILVL
jgi:hypothetical protein